MLLETSASNIVQLYLFPRDGRLPGTRVGIDPATVEMPKLGLGLELAGAKEDGELKPWRDVQWAGQGVSNNQDLAAAAELIRRLKAEYRNANEAPVEMIGAINA